MIITDKLGLKTFKDLADIENTDIRETLLSFSDNYNKLENEIDIKNNIESLDTNKVYKIGEKIWNSSPQVNSYVGWVNLRQGKYANTWKHETNYNIGDKVVTVDDNGFIYECVIDGMSGTKPPVLSVIENDEANDLGQASTRQNERNYKEGDIVLKTDGEESTYLKCITAGLTNINPPDKYPDIGVTIIDGSVVWLVCKTVRWKRIDGSCLFKPFGKIE